MLKDLNSTRLPPLMVVVFAVLVAQNFATLASGQTLNTAKGKQVLQHALKPAATPAAESQQDSRTKLQSNEKEDAEKGRRSDAESSQILSPHFCVSVSPCQSSRLDATQYEGVALHPVSSSSVAQLFPGEGEQAPAPLFPPPTQPSQPAQPVPEGQPRPSGGQPPVVPQPPPTQEPVPQFTPPPPGQPAPQFPPPPVEGQPAPPPEPEVLVAEVVVEGAEGELQEEIYRAIRTQPGRTTTRSQLQEDINAIFATGFFADVRAQPSDTPLGVRVTFVVEPNPVLRSLQLQGNQVLTQAEVDKIFGPQYGQILNFRRLQAGIKQLNQTYQSKGFILGQVVGAPKVDPSGTVTLQVAEGVIEDIQVRFLNKEDEPVKGKTRKFIITRELTFQPGAVLNRNQLQSDVRRVFGLGIFEDVQVALEPGQDPRKVILVLNIKERSTGTFGAGAGLSSASGLFGSVTFQEQNLGGNNQKLGTELQISQRDLLFDISFSDPWIATDPSRTSYTVNAFNRFTRPYVFSGGDYEVYLPPDEDQIEDDEGGDEPRVNRLGTGVTFSRPFAQTWTGSLGLQYQRVSIRDADLSIQPFACIDPGDDPAESCDPDNPASEGNLEPLSISPSGQDDVTTLRFSLANDLRNDPLRPTSGSLLRLSSEQYIPIGSGSIFGNKLVGSYSYFIPVRFTRFAEGPQTIAFNLQAGTAVGDLPPYDAFSLGGIDSVRGYGEGELGTGRSYAQFSTEYRFPVFSIVGGALFFDAATDLGTAASVLGEPAVVREKPGSGFGYGLGVRVQTPLGSIRVDYGLNDEGGSQLQFGIGERF